MTRILVTGGFGFIGGHLIAKLLADPNNQVHVVDNLSTSPIPLERLLDELGHPANLTYDIESVLSYCEHQRAIRSYGRSRYDQIYHLASPVGPAGILEHAGKMVMRVVSDTYDLLDLALFWKASFLDVSTSEVYGGGYGGRCAENMPRIIQPDMTVRLEYAIAKLAGEAAILNTALVNPLQAVIVRPFNVAGPRQSGVGGFVLPRFVEQAMKNEDITVFGDGSQVRAFTHVTDIVDGLILAMNRGKSRDVYNLGNPANRIRIGDLARMVQEVVGGGRITHVNGKDIYGPLYAEAQDKWPDANKSVNELGWMPKKNIEATIKDVWEYLLKQNERATI